MKRFFVVAAAITCAVTLSTPAVAQGFQHQWEDYWQNGQQYWTVRVFNNTGQTINCDISIRHTRALANSLHTSNFSTHAGLIGPGKSRRGVGAASGAPVSYEVSCRYA